MDPTNGEALPEESTSSEGSEKASTSSDMGENSACVNTQTFPEFVCGAIEVISPSVHLREMLDTLISAKMLLLMPMSDNLFEEIKHRVHEFINERQIFFAKAPHQVTSNDKDGE